jgi:hypothetical protein
MAGDLVTIYRKSGNGRIEALDVTPDEAARFIAKSPFAWSLSPAPASFAKWPWPPERGKPVEMLSLADQMGSTRTSSLWERT